MSDEAFATLAWRGRPLRLEYRWVGDAASAQPPVVFLHEGLGSIAMWKDFPARFCTEHGFKGLMFSRYGYGRSTPKPADEDWAPDFMHLQAFEVLPALFEALGIARPWLFGHSDGASIALLHAATYPVSGVVAMAPHVFVEDISIEGIETARDAYRNQDLRRRMSRHHRDADVTFWGWNDVWLDPEFRSWNIVATLGTIRCPMLLVQGEDDQYGSLAQLDAIERVVPGHVRRAVLACGHSPHLEIPEQTLQAVAGFVDTL
ncbi:MAG TPA: alpha/beta hydrolase [Burkholderiaceae bacterium]